MMNYNQFCVYFWGFIKEYNLLSLLRCEKSLSRKCMKDFTKWEKVWKGSMGNLNITSLSNLKIDYCKNSKIKVNGDILTYTSKGNACETCLLGEPMKKGIYRLTLKFLKSDDISICLTDLPIEKIPKGKRLCESHKGVEVSVEKVIDDYYAYIYNQKNTNVYEKFEVYEDDVYTFTVDLNSKNGDKRTFRISEKDRYKEYSMGGVPKNVRFGITMRGNDCQIAFVSLETLSELPALKNGLKVFWDKVKK